MNKTTLVAIAVIVFLLWTRGDSTPIEAPQIIDAEKPRLIERIKTLLEENKRLSAELLVKSEPSEEQSPPKPHAAVTYRRAWQRVGLFRGKWVNVPVRSSSGCST